jgi:lipopolysaccharide export system permease protein
MRILSRYVVAQHAAPFLFALSALTAFQLLNQIARRFGDLVGKGLPWGVIVEVFALSVPFIVTTTLSMAVLIAVLYTIGRLAADHELTAMRASGVSLGRLMVPLLSAGAVVTVLAFLFSDQVLPRSNHRLRTLLTDISRKKPTFALKEQVINEVQRGRLFLRAARIDQSTFALREVTIYDLADQQRKRIVRADHGVMALTPNQEDLYLTLFDGTMQELDRSDQKVFQQIRFRRNTIRVEGVGNVLNRTAEDTYKGDREMGVCEIENVVRAAERERELNARQLFAVRMNGLRSLVGFPPIEPDTALPPARLSAYCEALRRFAGFLLPAELRAQAAGSRRQPAEADQELMAKFNEPARQAFRTGRVDTPRLADVRGYQDRTRSAAIRSANYRVELHKKYAIAAACLVFVLIGVPMAVSFPRGGVGYVVGTSLAVFTVYYVCLIGGETLANRLLVPPFWAMWAPNVAFGVLGVVGLWRLRRATTPPDLTWVRLPWRKTAGITQESGRWWRTALAGEGRRAGDS